MILGLPDSVPTKKILSVIFREWDRNAQPRDQSKSDSIWATTQQIKNYGQYLVQMVLEGSSIDPAKGKEPFSTVQVHLFPGKLIFKENIRAINLTKGEVADLTL